MAGWSTLSDGSSLDCLGIAQTLRENGYSLDFDFTGCSDDSAACEGKGRCLFGQILSVLHNGARPLPAMLADGRSVDLFGLYSAVREMGGYSSVTENGLWSRVAEVVELGQDVGSSLKLVYVKYLNPLDMWMKRTARENGADTGHSEDISPASNIDDEMTRRGPSEALNRENGVGLDEVVPDRNESLDSVHDMNDDVNVDRVVPLQPYGVNYLQSKRKREEHGVELVGSSSMNNGKSGEREHLREMLHWVMGVAMDPWDPAIREMMPEELGDKTSVFMYWAQALKAREALILRRPGFSNIEQSLLQKRQRMHPSMYEDFVGCDPDMSRCSPQVLPQNRTSLSAYCSEASACPDNDLGMSSVPYSPTGAKRVLRATVLSVCKDRYQKRVPIGHSFQAEVPIWMDPISHSSDESRWLGYEQWPLGVDPRDAELIGKGRPDSCGCRLRGSVECVRFHVAEKRLLLKCELGRAFYGWKFDQMGEEISLAWTEEEENKFKGLVRLNPPSQTRSFWDPIYRSFPFKSRRSLVSYYFNVFLPRRRSYQNRVTPKNIDSDDEESEFVFLGGRLGHEKVNGCWPESTFCYQNRQYADLGDPLGVE